MNKPGIDFQEEGEEKRREQIVESLGLREEGDEMR